MQKISKLTIKLTQAELIEEYINRVKAESSVDKVELVLVATTKAKAAQPKGTREVDLGRALRLKSALASTGMTLSKVGKLAGMGGEAIRRRALGYVPCSQDELESILVAMGLGVNFGLNRPQAVTVGSEVRLLTDMRKGFGQVGDRGIVLDIEAGDITYARVRLLDGKNKGDIAIRVLNNLELV